jgi:pyrroloquinoline quinone (PQQ) biosynthesis protein C
MPTPKKMPPSEPFFNRLIADSTPAPTEFQAIPVIGAALRGDVSIDLYLAFLSQAFHHVKHTCRLLSFAVGHCRDEDTKLTSALLSYIGEERGHEELILDDIRALGGDAEAVQTGTPDLPCRLLVAYVYYAIQHVSPYAMLGMVHVLEGMSALLATQAAASLQSRLALPGGEGFSYLQSHGELDQDHVAFFRDQVNDIEDPTAQQAVIETATIVYRLYGDIFRALVPYEHPGIPAERVHAA